MARPEGSSAAALLKKKLDGRETDVLDALDIPWERTRGGRHIGGVYPDDPSKWRWEERISMAISNSDGKYHDFISVVERRLQLSFLDAMRWIHANIDFADADSGSSQVDPSYIPALQQYSTTNAKAPGEKLLARADGDASLILNYLRARCPGFEPLMPRTKCIGLPSVGYFDQGSKNKTKRSEHPCAVFGFASRNGEIRRALRIYLASEGRGKADLKAADGTVADCKKWCPGSAESPDTGMVVFGAVDWLQAPLVIVTEGVETAHAIAVSHRKECLANRMAIVAMGDAGSLKKFVPFHPNQRIIVAADRDEGVKINGRSRLQIGEKAARELVEQLSEHEVKVALPGKQGEKKDWLDILNEQGAAVVRRGIRNAGIGIKQACIEAEEVRDYVISKGGKIVPNEVNVQLALSRPPLEGLVGVDLMTQRLALLRPVPGQKAVGRYPQNFNDKTATKILAVLQSSLFPTLRQDTLERVLPVVADLHAFHPIRQQLQKIKWDGTSRLGYWLHRYLGAPDTPYTRRIGSMFLMMMIERVFNPGCKADYMLVLEGNQGTKKSQACRILAGIDYFSDGLPNIAKNSKDAQIHIAGKWLIEIAELFAFRHSHPIESKNFLTQCNQIYRRPYGQHEVTEPRQCVFIATTNEHHYLQDATGNRRYWPVDTGEIDLKRLEADRDQLLAEAFFRRRLKRERYWPNSKFEAKYILPEQRARLRQNETVSEVLDYLDKNKLAEVKLRDLRDGLGLADWDRQRSMVVTALARAGYRSKRGSRHETYCLK